MVKECGPTPRATISNAEAADRSVLLPELLFLREQGSLADSHPSRFGEGSRSRLRFYVEEGSTQIKMIDGPVAQELWIEND